MLYGERKTITQQFLYSSRIATKKRLQIKHCNRFIFNVGPPGLEPGTP